MLVTCFLFVFLFLLMSKVACWKMLSILLTSSVFFLVCSNHFLLIVYCFFFFCEWLEIVSDFFYLLNEINCLLKVHAKVNECPLNALASVFFLLKDEHMMIEELLQLLVGEVDAKLFKTVELFVQDDENKKKRGNSCQFTALLAIWC